MSTQLAALSNELAAAVQQAERHVVAVHARPRFSSSGVLWKPGVVVTAEHTIRREEEIRVTLPDGNTVPATLALALGRSEDSGVNASLGIISARSGEWRTWRGGQLDHYIRLDVNVFPTSDGDRKSVV